GAAALIVRRNMREVRGGHACRRDPPLTLPGQVRMDEAAVQAVLRGTKAPELELGADASPPNLPPEVRAARLACLREARVHVLPGGHHLHMEQADVVAPLLLDFLRG